MPLAWLKSFAWIRSKHNRLFPPAAQLNIVASHKESATPKYLGITAGGERAASFTTSQRFEQTVLSGEGHRGPVVPGIDNIDAAQKILCDLPGGNINSYSSIWKVLLSQAERGEFVFHLSLYVCGMHSDLLENSYVICCPGLSWSPNASERILVKKNSSDWQILVLIKLEVQLSHCYIIRNT